MIQCFVRILLKEFFALHELNHLYKEKLSRRELLAFHSRYKLQLLAHSRAGYKDMGPFVAAIHEWADLESYFEVYRDNLMAILRKPASRKKSHECADAYTGVF